MDLGGEAVRRGRATRRAAGYGRVSSVRQAEEGLSIEEQPRRLRQRIAAEGWTCVEMYIDPGVSGRSMRKRDRLLRMLEDAEAGRFEVLVIPSLDRLGRSVKDLAVIFERLAAAGVEVVSLRGDVNMGGGATATLTTNVMSALAQFYTDLLSEQVRAVSAARVREKRQPWFSRHVPPGYAILGESGSKTYVVDPERLPIARRVFDEADAGKPVTAIARDLARDGLLSYSVTSLTKLLRNPIYIGSSKVPRTEELIETHEAIIERDQWERVQSLLDARKRLPGQGRGRPAEGFLLKGLLRCGHCGTVMKPVPGKPRRDGTRPDRYVCPRRAQFGPTACPLPRLPREALDRLPLDGLLLKGGIDFEDARRRLTDSYDQARDQVAALHSHALRSVARFEAQLDRQQGRWRDGEITTEDWSTEQADIGESLTAARDDVERFETRLAEFDAAGSLIDAEGILTGFLRDLRERVATGLGDPASVDAARGVLLRVFESFTVIPLLGDADGFAEPHWPSFGTEGWAFTDAMRALDFDLVPRLREGIREMLPQSIAVPTNSPTSR